MRRTNPQVDRYQLVKLRQEIRSFLLAEHSNKGSYACYYYLAGQRKIPNKSDGEQLSLEGFVRQYRTVKKDINHSYTDFSICFLHKAFVGVRRVEYSKNRSGIRELMRMTGLQEVTIKDILILNGEIQ